MKICNNKDGLPSCSGGCYDNGVCLNKGKCEDSLVVKEDLLKTLMVESGRHDKMVNNFKEKANTLRELDR